MLYLAVFRLFTDLITNSTRLQTQIMTPAYNFADNTCSGVIHCLRTWISVAKISRASDFPFQKKEFSVSKEVKFRFDSVSLLATLNSMKSQYIERKCGERTVKIAQLVR